MMSHGDMHNHQLEDICILEWEPHHLDSRNIDEFKAQANTHIGSSIKVVLDLTAITFIDSAGLGALLSLLRTMQERKGDFRVCCAGKAIQLLFELVHINKIMDIHKTREDAIEASAKASID